MIGVSINQAHPRCPSPTCCWVDNGRVRMLMQRPPVPRQIRSVAWRFAATSGASLRSGCLRLAVGCSCCPDPLNSSDDGLVLVLIRLILGVLRRPAAGWIMHAHVDAASFYSQADPIGGMEVCSHERGKPSVRLFAAGCALQLRGPRSLSICGRTDTIARAAGIGREGGGWWGVAAAWSWAVICGVGCFMRAISGGRGLHSAGFHGDHT